MKSIRIAVTVAALITTACSAGSASPSASAPSSGAATASSLPTATASPTPLATASALPEGTYQTPPIPNTTLQATAEAAGFTWDAATWPNTTTVYAIRLENGHLNWFDSADGAPLSLSSNGYYEVTDAHTIAYTDAEDSSCRFILTFSLEGDLLTTHVDPDPPCAGIEAIIFFNSAPFVRQP